MNTKRKTTYIVLEGSEGTGKSTQTKILVETLKNKGFSVLETKEPGTDHAPLTMKLRGIMLDGKYENEMTKEAREMISQAIRSIHLNKVIYPAIGQYDFIVQDRGILSGTAYGVACDNPLEYITYLAEKAIGEDGKKMGLNINNLYDHVIVFRGNIAQGLNRAKQAKQEFESGDAMENRGVSFLEKVNQNFQSQSSLFQNVSFIDTEGKTIESISAELLKVLQIP
jgi:dTMP kinase